VVEEDPHSFAGRSLRLIEELFGGRSPSGQVDFFRQMAFSIMGRYGIPCVGFWPGTRGAVLMLQTKVHLEG